MTIAGSPNEDDRGDDEQTQKKEKTHKSICRVLIHMPLAGTPAKTGGGGEGRGGCGDGGLCHTRCQPVASPPLSPIDASVKRRASSNSILPSSGLANTPL